MNILPQNIYSGSQVRELDRLAIEKYGMQGSDLMQRAGSAAFSLLRQKWPRAQTLIVVVGSGNNGGDGFVVATLAKRQGLQVRVLHTSDPSRIRGDAKLARDAYLQIGGSEMRYSHEQLHHADVIIDAILGTGLVDEVKEDTKKIIQDINDTHRPIFALDIPSGLHADTGYPLGSAIKATCTITFVGLKLGLFTGMGGDYTGQVYFDDLQIPQSIYNAITPICKRIAQHDVHRVLVKRRSSTHKGECGHVLLVGGNRGMLGAILLAAQAAARVGAGLVSIVTLPEHAAAASSAIPTVMAHGVHDKNELDTLIKRANVIAIGPGLGTNAWAAQLFAYVMEQKLSLVVDADALNLLAGDPMQRDNWVLTPHPGEAARLLNTTSQQVQRDRLKAVQQLQARFKGGCVLKGPGTLITSTTNTWLSTTGNPGMASGGVGDVLTGVIAGLIAQGTQLDAAAAIGVYIHGKAAELAAAEGGERGMIASDLFPHLRWLVNEAGAHL